MRGYLDGDRLTASAYDGGWFRTGDLARELPDGRVELRGRLKDLINRGGNKVAPAEIELAIGPQLPVGRTGKADRGQLRSASRSVTHRPGKAPP